MAIVSEEEYLAHLKEVNPSAYAGYMAKYKKTKVKQEKARKEELDRYWAERERERKSEEEARKRKEQEKKFEEGLKKDERIIRFVFFILAACGFFWFRICVVDEADRKARSEQLMSYYKYNPIVVPAITTGGNDVGGGATIDKGSVKVKVPEWHDHGGDKEACRKALMERFRIIYGDPKFQRSPTAISARYKGDTLYMFSACYREPINRYAVLQDSTIMRFIRDCGFRRLKLGEYDAGKVKTWYKDFDEHGNKIPHYKEIEYRRY